MIKPSNLIYLLIFFNILTFFFGFIYSEEHGASILDANLHTYPAIDGLKNNFIQNIITYGKYGENSYPLHHIIYAYTNLFEIGSIFFRIQSCILSLIVIIFFYLILNLRFKIKIEEALFLSSILLLSPYFRTSAYWGMTENTGLIFLIISIFFFLKLLNSEDKKFNQLLLICLFSALALYARLQYVFLCIFFFFYLSYKLNLNRVVFVTINYIIYSIPGLILIYIWGGLLDEQYSGEFNYFINANSIPRTLLVIFSLIGFYSLPFILILNDRMLNVLRKNIINFFISLLICSSVYFFFDVNILALDETNSFPYGQGFVSHILYKFTSIKESYLIFCALGLLVTYKIFNFTIRNKFLIIALLSIFSLRVHFFSEYLDPLLFILFFTLLDFDKKKMLLTLKNILLLEFFFLGILIGAILI